MAEQKFEDALKSLETIVNNLESGDLNLDDAIKRYEDGMKLSQVCKKKLDEIKKKVDILVKDSTGKVSTKAFDSEDLEAEEKKPLKKRRPKGEEMLF